MARHEGEFLQHSQHEVHGAGHHPVGEPVLRLEAAVEGGEEVGGVLPRALAQAEQAAHRHQLLAKLLLGWAPRQGRVRVEVELPNKAIMWSKAVHLGGGVR